MQNAHLQLLYPEEALEGERSSALPSLLSDLFVINSLQLAGFILKEGITRSGLW